MTDQFRIQRLTHTSHYSSLILVPELQNVTFIVFKTAESKPELQKACKIFQHGVLNPCGGSGPFSSISDDLTET